MIKIACFLSLVGFATTITAGSAQQPIPDVCATLASRLTPDVMIQGSSSQQFSQLQQLVSDQRYQDYGSASSSANSFNLGFSIPDEVDLAIGDGQHSNSSNWGSRRAKFLSINFQQSSSAFQQSNYLSQTSVAAIHEISECAQTIANARANGVFINLDAVSPNRDSFAVQLAYRTDGNPSNWELTDFHVEPADPQFKCNGFEHASDSQKIPLTTLKREIGCSKSPDAHLTLVVNTSQGGGTAISLDSIQEQIQKLRDDIQSQIGSISAALSKETADRAAAISAIKPRIVSGPSNPATPMPWPAGFGVTGSCTEGVIVGYYCHVNTGQGDLQTEGIRGDSTFNCEWAHTAPWTNGAFTAEGYPVCAIIDK